MSKLSYYEKNKERLKQLRKTYYIQNKEKCSAYMKRYRLDNYESCKAMQKMYYIKHPKAAAIYHRNKKKNDPMFKCSCAIRTLISMAVKTYTGKKKNTKTASILGCSIVDFKSYIEQQFKDGMTWLNHGRWHLDHRIPLASAHTEEELLNLNHFTNFQPLWSKDNLIKGASLIYG